MTYPTKKLGEVCDLIGGGTPAKSNPDFYTGDILWATVGDMRNDYIEDTALKITPDAVEKSSTHIIPKGNVVIATRVGLGKICFTRFDTAINQDLRGVRPKKTAELSVEFLFWWFKSISDEIIKHGTGATVHGVKQTYIKNLEIPLPPLPEQKRIVKILDEVFEKIEKAKENTEKNLMNVKELFTVSLKEAFKNKGEGWEEKRLEDICNSLDSKRIPVTKRNRKTGEYPYYGASGIVDYVDGYIFDDDLLLVSEDGANLLARVYPIAFSVSGKTWVNNHAHVLRFAERATQHFVEYYLNSISLTPYVSGMAQPKLNQKMLNSIPLSIPHIEKQRSVVSRLDSLSAQAKKLEAIYQQKLADLDELKKSVLKKAFSGEL